MAIGTGQVGKHAMAAGGTRSLRLLAAGLATLLAGFASLPPAAAQPAWFSQEYLAAHFAASAANPALMRAELETEFGPIPDAIWTVMERHMTGVLADPRYADFVYTRGAPYVSMTMTADDLPIVTMQVELQATFGGVLRMPQKRQEEFLRVSGDVFRWMRENEPAACSEALLGDDLTTAARDELRFLAAQTPAYVDAYYTTVYAALSAEIAGAPDQRRVEQEIDDRAPFGIYQAAVIALVGASPNGDAILRAVALGEDENPALLCEFGEITIDAIFTLTPADRQSVVLGILGEAAGLPMMPD